MTHRPDKAIDMLRAARRLPGAGTHPLIGMSDPERLAEPFAALDALPRGAIMILRPAYSLPARHTRFYHRKARTRNQILLISSSARGQTFEIAEGRHLPEQACYRRHLDLEWLSAAAHGEKALVAAARAGARLVLISPVFATASHIGGRSLGVVRLAQLVSRARQLGLMPYALGGITAIAQVQRLCDTGICGIAGIGFLQA